jgi:hypothetical protein
MGGLRRKSERRFEDALVGLFGCEGGWKLEAEPRQPWVRVSISHCECSQKPLQNPFLSQSEAVVAFIKRNTAYVG